MNLTVQILYPSTNQILKFVFLSLPPDNLFPIEQVSVIVFGIGISTSSCSWFSLSSYHCVFSTTVISYFFTKNMCWYFCVVHFYNNNLWHFHIHRPNLRLFPFQISYELWWLSLRSASEAWSSLPWIIQRSTPVTSLWLLLRSSLRTQSSLS